jgi:hypothetical protein
VYFSAIRIILLKVIIAPVMPVFPFKGYVTLETLLNATVLCWPADHPHATVMSHSPVSSSYLNTPSK